MATEREAADPNYAVEPSHIISSIDKLKQKRNVKKLWTFAAPGKATDGLYQCSGALAHRWLDISVSRLDGKVWSLSSQ